MSIYDTVKAEFGVGPAYASRGDFTKYHGYKGGKSIGIFASKQEATEAGAVATEKEFDEEAYLAASKGYKDHASAVEKEWYKRIRAEYPELNDATFKLVERLAWEDGHSAGYGEVENYISTYAEFANEIIKASGK